MPPELLGGWVRLKCTKQVSGTIYKELFKLITQDARKQSQVSKFQLAKSNFYFIFLYAVGLLKKRLARVLLLSTLY